MPDSSFMTFLMRRGALKTWSRVCVTPCLQGRNCFSKLHSTKHATWQRHAGTARHCQVFKLLVLHPSRLDGDQHMHRLKAWCEVQLLFDLLHCCSILLHLGRADARSTMNYERQY